MKNIYKMLFAFVSIVLVSCTADDVENRPVLESITTPEVVAPESSKSYVLMEANKDNDADRFVWSAAKYSDKVVVEYALMIDVQGGDFTEAKTLATTNGLTHVGINVKDLNQIVVALGAEPGVAKLFDIKVMSTVAGKVPMTSKKALTITVTAYAPAVANNCPNQYAVGAGIVSAGWNWNTPLTLVCNDKVLITPVDLQNDTFRFFTTKGEWGSGRNYPWYVEAGYKISSNLENALDGDSNFRFTGTPGVHRLKIDENAKTITAVQGETAASSFWLVGAATPGGWSWSGDNETEFGLVKNGVYEVPVKLISGEAFRVFLGNDGTDNGNWGSSNNFPFYVNAGYTISAELVNAADGDSNFKYTGPTAIRLFKIDTNAKTITLN